MSTQRRFLIVFSIGLVLTSIGIFFRLPEFVALSLPPFLYSGALLVSHILLGGTRISVRCSVKPDCVTEGEEFEMALSFVQRGPTSAIVGVGAHVPDRIEWVEGDTSFLGYLRAEEIKSIFCTVRAKRGEHQLSDIRTTLWSRHGLAMRESKAHCALQIRSLPRVSRLNPIPIRPRRTRAFAGPIRANLGGTGIDFFGARAYNPGDDPRRINWRAYALREELIITEFEQERITDVNLILDARAGVHTPIGGTSTFEYAARATASLAAHFLDQGNNVGLLIYGDYLNWICPSLGRIQRERILDALSQAEIADKTAFEDLRQIPTRLFPPRSQLVLISALYDEKDVETLALLCARGYSLLLLCPDSLSLEQTALPTGPTVELAHRLLRLERTVFLESLAKIGVRVVDWALDRSLDEAMEQARQRPGGRPR